MDAFPFEIVKKNPYRISHSSLNSIDKKQGRRVFISSISIGFLGISKAYPASAVRDFARVGLLGGSNIVDVNNANIRVFLKMDGMYPNIARKIVVNGPYKNVREIFDIPDLSEKEKEIIRRHESRLTATKPSPEYFIDRINNGLYR